MNDHSKMDYFMWMQTQFGSGTIFSEKIRGAVTTQLLVEIS